MRCESVYEIFSAMPTLETERLRLRPMRVGDCFDMFEYARRADVTEYLTWSPHRDIEYTKSYLAYIAGHYRLGDFYDWALEYKPEGKMIGTCGFTRFDFAHDCGEVGYVINPAYRGRGLAPEAVRCVLGFGFERLGLHRIESRYIVGNEASRRVMEKVGMCFEGISYGRMRIRGKYRDIGTCALLRDMAKKGEN